MVSAWKILLIIKYRYFVFFHDLAISTCVCVCFTHSSFYWHFILFLFFPVCNLSAFGYNIGNTLIFKFWMNFSFFLIFLSPHSLPSGNVSAAFNWQCDTSCLVTKSQSIHAYSEVWILKFLMNPEVLPTPQTPLILVHARPLLPTTSSPLTVEHSLW